MKWLVTGDWQTRFSNLRECKQAHEQELSIIKEHKISGHIDLGDLKDEYSPVAVEVVEFQFARTKNIFDLINPRNTIKLLGNHDRIGQHSDERNWLSLFTYLGGHIISEPDIVHCETASIYGLPFTRNEEAFNEGADYLAYKLGKDINNVRTKILIFHQDINGAKYSRLRGKRSDSKISVETIHAKIYDQVFGGHIHLRQKLAKNSRYVGSPFAMDWGEIDQRKGFTIYDDQTNRVEFIDSVVPGRFSFAYLQKKHIEKVSTGTQIKDTVLCGSVVSNYHRIIDRRIREISKAYPNATIQVVPKFETDGGEIQEAANDCSEAEKLRIYIRSSLPLDLKKDKKRVNAYLQSVLEKSLGKRIRSSERVTFERVEATNVLSFEHVAFDFRKRGTVCIAGKNNSGGILKSNGAGKTNFLSLPCVALQGKTFKKQEHDGWANWRMEGPALITQDLRISKGTKYTVLRGRRPAKLQLLENGKDISEGKTPRQVQDQIEELIGFTYDTLANSVYVDQTLSNAFILGTDGSRAELISKFLNLDKYEVARAYAADDLKKLKASESETEYQIGLLKDSVKEKEEELTHQKKDESKKKHALLKELLEAEKLQRIEEKKAGRKLHKLRFEIKGIQRKSELLEKKNKDITSQLYMLESIIASNKKNVERINRMYALGKCSECQRPVTKDNQKDMVTQAKKVVEKKRKQYDELTQQLKAVSKKREKYSSAHSSLEEKVELVEGLVEGGKRYIRDLKSKLEAFEELQKEQAKASQATHRIQQLKKKIKVSKQYLEDIQEQKVIVCYAIETFSKKGFPAFLSKLICPVLNKASEYYSNLFLDGEIEVVFEVVKDALTPKIVNPNGDKEIKGQSQGEKAWAGQIASFALREIAQPSNLLILDEPGNGLDASGASRFGERIKKLEDRFETILVTTHNVHLLAALEGCENLEIVKTNKISSIAQDS